MEGKQADVTVSASRMKIADDVDADSVIQRDEHADMRLFQALKKWRRVTLYCVLMTSPILMYGYDYVIVGTVSAMPSFQYDYGYQYNGKWVLPSLWLGLWNMASPAASMIGAIIGGLFQDWFGRRVSLGTGSFLSAVGVAVIYVSSIPDDIGARRGLFLGGKAFQGGAIGMVMATAQTYMSKILPPVLRGPILAFIPTFTLLGQLIGAGVIYACLDMDNGYVVAYGTQWAFSAVPLIVSFIIPESPTYLVRKGKIDKALKAQKRLNAPGQDTQRTIALLQRSIEREQQETQATYVDCFKAANTRRTMIVVFANLLPQIFGLALLSKASYFIQVVGMDADLSVLVLVLGILCGFLANLASIWVLSRIGRRSLVLTTLAVAIVLWGTMGISGIWSGKATVWYTAAMMILIIVVCGVGVWPCSYAIGAETSSLHLRAKAQGVGWLTQGASAAILGFILPYIFNPDQGDLGAKTGFFYAGLCVIGFVVSFFYVPEMKGRTPDEIDGMFERKLGARAFKTWSHESTGA